MRIPLQALEGTLARSGGGFLRMERAILPHDEDGGVARRHD